uniref:Oligopeptide transporter 1 n=1 Tax=Steinernema glaseri TaxID=37863 RepID=A0A1I8ANF1_9BILA
MDLNPIKVDSLVSFDELGLRNARPEDLDPEPTEFMERLRRWPKSTFCIVGNEFCERFSYLGMRSVLTLYLINILQFSNDNATILYHAFTVFAFSSPLLGSIIADGYIGKFWTIFSLSIIYACGNVVLAVASTFDKDSHFHPWLDLAGLLVIAMGTGGIKPCVSSFGADQFPSHYVVMISIFFSVFYFTINAGSMISMFVTPFFRTVPCMNHDSCYPLAFGIPAVLMVVSTIIFVLGSFFYKKVPPKDNVIARVFKAVCKAVYNRITKRSVRREHWLDHYLDGHKCDSDPQCIALAVKGKRIGEKCAQQQFADDIKSLVRVTVMMLPVPMFWALYDQQGSRWLIQAVAMNSEIWPGYSLLPDQMGVLNAILILLFIPLFQAFVYPAVEKCGIRTTPLRRMVLGGLLAAVAFSVCGFVQLKVNQTLPDIPADNMGFVSVINTFKNCNIHVTADGTDKYILANQSLVDDKVRELQQLYHFNVGDHKAINFNFTYAGSECFDYDKAPFSVPLDIKGGKTYFVAATPQGIFSGTSSIEKPQEGAGESSVSLNLLLPCSSLPTNVTWDHGCKNTASPKLSSYSSRIAACEFSEKPHCDPRNKKYYVWKEKDASLSRLHSDGTDIANGTAYAHKDIRPGVYQLFYVRYLKPDGDRTPSENDLEFYPIDDVILDVRGQGGVYTLTVATNGVYNVKENIFNLHAVVPKNHVSILWQVPQYVIITAAEILFSITGLEFSYSQAAPSLKSVVTAIWWFTVAFGDLVIIIIDKIVRIEDLAIIMFVFAAAMVVVIGVFILMSIFYYEYVDYSKKQDDRSPVEGNDNLSYEYDDEDCSTKL